MPGLGFMAKSKPLRLDSGTLLVPSYHERDSCPFVMRVDDEDAPLDSSLVAETMAVSTDAGRQWCRVLDPVRGDGEYSCPCVLTCAGGTVAVSYTHSRCAIRVASLEVGLLMDAAVRAKPT